MKNREITLSEVGEIIRHELIGDNITVKGLNYADYESQYDSVLTYCVNPRYLRIALDKKKFRAVITTKKSYDALEKKQRRKASFFLVGDPVSTFFYLHNYLYEKTGFYNDHDFPQKIGNGCDIHESAIIEDGVTIGDSARVGPNASILRGSIIGNSVHIEANCVIGASSLETKNVFGKLTQIAHAGGVIINDGAGIGANTVVNRELFEGWTVIGEEVQIDALVYIAHGVHIGKKTVVAAGVITAGDIHIGDNTLVGLGARIRGGIRIGNNVKINIGAVVVENVRDKEIVAGFYAMPNAAWLLKTLNNKKRYTKY